MAGMSFPAGNSLILSDIEEVVRELSIFGCSGCQPSLEAVSDEYQ